MTRLAGEALVRVGLRRRGPVVVLPSGPGAACRTVLRVPVLDRHGRGSVVVVKTGDACVGWEHLVSRALHEAAEHLRGQGVIGHNSVPRVLHDRAFEVSGQWVSVREFVDPVSTVAPRDWGRLMASLHLLGSRPAALALLRGRPSNVLHGLDARRLRSTLRAPGHPFRRQEDLLRELASALRCRAVEAQKADPVPLLVHRDLHPGNLVAGAAGPVAIDWAEAGWGSRSDDFAWLHVAVTRFGAPASVLQDVRAGYADVAPGACPTAEQIRAAGRVRELVCLTFSIQNAALSPAHLYEAEVELPILNHPDAVTPRWLPLFNPAAFFHPTLRTARSTHAERRWAS